MYGAVVVGVILARAFVDATGQPLAAYWQPGLGIAAASSLLFVGALFLRDYAISSQFKKLLGGQ